MIPTAPYISGVAGPASRSRWWLWPAIVGGVALLALIAVGALAAYGQLARRTDNRAAGPNPQDIFREITTSPPAISDPLSAPGANAWEQAAGYCAFQGGAYVVSQGQTGYRTQCRLLGHTYRGFAMQADMRLLSGGPAGLILYTSEDDALNTGYRVTVTASGAYTLVAASGNQPVTLEQGSASGFAAGYGQVNTLMVAVTGGVLYAYINGAYVVSYPLGGGHIGLLGFYAYDAGEPTQAAFTNASIWTLT